MPLDSVQSHDYFKHYVIGEQLKFTLIPRRCHLSGRIIWLESAYCITAMYTGPGSPVYENRWYGKNEYIVARLKDLI